MKLMKPTKYDAITVFYDFICRALSVLTFYRNDSSAAPYQQQLPGCALDCPLEDFVKITKPWISDDREKECQLPSDGTNKGEV